MINDNTKKLIWEVAGRYTTEDIVLGWLRYETVRKFTPHDFGVVYKSNLEGENFDALIDMGVNAAADLYYKRKL